MQTDTETCAQRSLFLLAGTSHLVNPAATCEATHAPATGNQKAATTEGEGTRMSAWRGLPNSFDMSLQKLAY